MILTILYYVGVRLAEKNCLIEAVEHFTRAITLNPENPSPYNNRAQAYQLQNKTNGQLDFFFMSPLILFMFGF